MYNFWQRWMYRNWQHGMYIKRVKKKSLHIFVNHQNYKAYEDSDTTPQKGNYVVRN